MHDIALGLFAESLRTALALLLPAIVIVAAVGVIVGLVQTIVQVQDQNVAFAPKVVAIALLAALAGPAALEILLQLLSHVVALLPRIAHA